VTEEQNTKESVKPADALGTLSRRTRASRFVVVIGAVILVFALVFLVGLFLRGFSTGSNAPAVPKVEI